MTMDVHQATIFKLYIVHDKPLWEVIKYLKDEHGFETSPKKLKTKLKEWHFTKNISRSQVLAIIRNVGDFEPSDVSAVAKRDWLVESNKFSQYCMRAKLGTSARLSNTGSTRTSLQHTPIIDGIGPLSLPLITPPEDIRIPEALFHDCDELIKFSFESGEWSPDGYNQIIQSSANQGLEKRSLHTLLGNLDTAYKVASSGNFFVAGEYWHYAFEEIKTLVQGKYHDIIPNLLQMINDLSSEGHRGVALQLKDFISQSCIEHRVAEGYRSRIFKSFAHMEIAHFSVIEERVMHLFVEVFTQYLGPTHYNSFVMRMNAARRKLLRDSSAKLDEWIPSLTLMDQTFDELDRRSLDIIRLRVEISHHRGEYERTEYEAAELVRRAELVSDDEWQRFYFLVKGHYHSGSAQYLLKKYQIALLNFHSCLGCIEKFSKLDQNGIFNPEKAVILSYMHQLSLAVVSVSSD